MEALWTVELFGGLRAVPRADVAGGEAVTRFRTQRAAGLLARLAFRLGRAPLTRDALAEELWPYSNPERSLARLAVELSALRAQLEPVGVPRGGVLVADRFALSLDPTAVRTDVSTFEAACDRARLAEDDAGRVRLLGEAEALYAGPLLPTHDADWVAPERERLAARYLEAVRDFAGICLRQGNADDAVRAARSAAERERNRDAAHCLLLRVLLDAGRAEDARRHFLALEKALVEADAEPPSAEARRLADEAARAGRSESVPPAPPTVPVASPPAVATLPNITVALPSGTVAVLNTDIVGSTALGRRLGEATYEEARERHHALLRREITRSGGHEFKESGDGFWVAFETARDALVCAAACQEALSGPDAPPLDPPLRVRMALHIAHIHPDAGGGDYHGLDLHDAARVLGASNGAQVLVSEAAEAVLRRHLPDGFTLVDRGVYLLKDAPGPEHLFEARWPRMPVPDLPPPNAKPAHTPSLPPTFNRFFGRDAEVTSVATALAEARSGDVRVVTLTGLGGTGKTRLAVETARAAADAFAGAVWFAALADVEDAARIPAAVAAAVGASVGPGDPWAALDAVLGGQPSLLILDNLEHLLDSSGAEGAKGAEGFVQAAVGRWPALVVLATSRQRLGLGAEREYPVAPLPPPAAGSTPESLLRVGSVALFDDRARRARPDFRVTERNAAAVAELCDLLEGIPLALELAAAWARVLSPAEMLTQLPEIQRTRDKNVPERHRSLTAAIEGSYRLLDDDQRRFFRRLAVFRGGWTASAARAVCDEPFALDLLADLRDRSLVTVRDEGDGTRFAFLETLREFADAKLATETPGEADAARARHRDHYAALAEEAEPELKGAHQAAWLSRLAAEHQNLRAALSGLDPSGRLQTASRLHRYWMVRGHLAEGRRWLEAAEAEPADGNGPVPEPVRLKALAAAGALCLTGGDLDAAQRLFATARQRAETTGNSQAAGGALVNLAILASLRGDLDAARRDYESSLPLWRSLGNDSNLSIALSNLGALLMRMHDLDAARGVLEESLRVQERSGGDPLLRANTLHNLAEVAADQEDYGTALWRLHDSLHVRLEIGDRSGAPNLLFLLARIRARQERCEEAAWLFGAGEAACADAQTTLPARARSQVETTQAEVCSVLGETVFRKNWEQGQATHWDLMIVRVLELLEP